MHLACKQTLYKLGWYQFKPPPVHSIGWSDQDWINWITACNGWLPNGGRKPFFMPEWIRKLGASLKDSEYFDAGTKLETNIKP